MTKTWNHQVAERRMVIHFDKGKPDWVIGIAWLNSTLYIGLFIYIEFHFVKESGQALKEGER